MTGMAAIPLDIHIVTIHPQFIESYVRFGVFRAAIAGGLVRCQAIDLRDFAVDKHASIDDLPYGGGDGMVMRPEPLAAAVSSLPVKPTVIMTSPGATPWTQATAQKFATTAQTGPASLLFVCGRFAGVDQRFIDRYVDHEFSLGDVVVSGGELPVLMMADSILRLIPGVLGDEASARFDSFAEGFDGLLEHPLYTRPREFEGVPVPEVLLSGDHKAIARWRADESRKKTAQLRPDLLKKQD
jgi:tRNA (guanine37-N1)-methyltransferase